MNKTCQINLRLTSQEMELLKSKAKTHKSLSSYIIDTCLSSDDKLTTKKLDFLESWANKYISYKSEFSHQNNNLNQLAKYLNSTDWHNDKVLDEIKLILNSIFDINERISLENQEILSIYRSFYITK